MLLTNRRILGTVAAVALFITACTGGTESPAASAGGGEGDAASVAITLQEWAVVTDSDSAPAGEVVFTVTNEGPDDIHEFVVIRTDLDVADLPVDENGAVDEAGEGMEVLGEIEDLPVGETQDLALTLEAGSYALICNIWSEDEQEAHYAMGMRTAFTATE